MNLPKKLPVLIEITFFCAFSLHGSPSESALRIQTETAAFCDSCADLNQIKLVVFKDSIYFETNCPESYCKSLAAP